ncbi:hypothetical protein [Pseudomonas sp. NPDC096950]|uniref:hypothetical protein n=1 Tax=Pseudomonas sp. NPDC096950 TaxID=3364485 RepID=UPI00383AB9EE
MSSANCDTAIQQISTPDFVATLSLDQLRAARSIIEEKIKAAEAQPKRIVWQVCRDGVIDKYFREERFEAAADHLLSIFKERFQEIAEDFVANPYGTHQLQLEMPHITAELVPQFEYETQWFPAKTQ